MPGKNWATNTFKCAALK
uniref:Uncharacterized protein n=1 Tax=Rhizophora mucronata TaxID=61149 RepID=A0A2P2MYW9_RHIMU